MKKIPFYKQSWGIRSRYGGYTVPKFDLLYGIFLIVAFLSAITWIIIKVAKLFGWEII